MLFYLVVAVHAIVAIILVLVVLLQSGKGADLAGAFGGGATQTAFGSRGPASFLSRMTTVAAVVFMLTSIGLALLAEKNAPENKSILETSGKAAAPADEKKPVTAPQSVPTPAQIEEQIKQIQEQQQSAPSAPAQGNSEQPAQ